MHIAVCKQQGSFSLDVRFSGKADGVTALCGPSGSGKTSVINMVAGLSRPDSGTISLAGNLLFDSAAGICLPPEARRVGYVFQEGRLFPHLSIRANLTYGMKLIPRAKRVIHLDQVVGLLGIEHLLSRRPRKLSGGEKQRVAIGRALLISPFALLMDEPLASLDEARKEELLPYIATVNKEFHIPVLYVSHAMEEVERIADTVIRMENGRVVS
ncbi:molybdenum ABC transporter ATP-binding protein [Desulfovibrio sp. OttesenSCG-928-G15]|nr:molybdenum ABC transporter ATP-binding protein [Desulfovibrio sp. OttesenSCG-928-G15]